MNWQLVSRLNGLVIAQFLNEAAARDYARWRNDGRRRWMVMKIIGDGP